MVRLILPLAVWFIISLMLSQISGKKKKHTREKTSISNKPSKHTNSVSDKTKNFFYVSQSEENDVNAKVQNQHLHKQRNENFSSKKNKNTKQISSMKNNQKMFEQQYNRTKFAAKQMVAHIANEYTKEQLNLSRLDESFYEELKELSEKNWDRFSKADISVIIQRLERWKEKNPSLPDTLVEFLEKRFSIIKDDSLKDETVLDGTVKRTKRKHYNALGYHLAQGTNLKTSLIVKEILDKPKSMR